MTEVMTLRLGDDLIQELNSLSQSEAKDRSAIVRELLHQGLHERKVTQALKKYEQGQVTLWKAANLAEVSIWRMIELLHERNVLAQYGVYDLRQDLMSLKKE